MFLKRWLRILRGEKRVPLDEQIWLCKRAMRRTEKEIEEMDDYAYHNDECCSECAFGLGYIETVYKVERQRAWIEVLEERKRKRQKK